MQSFLRSVTLILISVGITFYLTKNSIIQPPISLFPMQNYQQDIGHWINTKDSDFDKPLLTSSQQKIRTAEWYDHYYGKHSPWQPDHIQQVLNSTYPYSLKNGIQEKINNYSNKNKPDDKIGYGANFRPYSEQWIGHLERIMNLSQFDASHYDASRRAIAINNIEGRQLPTNEVHFYHYKFAGQGYPFDNLQAAVIWAGTPLYVLGETVEHDWSLVLAPSFIAWVKSTDIARVNDAFIKEWQASAQSNLVALVKTNVAIKDIEDHLYRFSGFIGMVFPGKMTNNEFHIMIPISDSKRQAHIHHAMLSKQNGVLMPLLPTTHHFADILGDLMNRTYGWGGMYFYNDCASELKNLYTPFGIWLPIHSSDQVNQEQYLFKKVDLSNDDLGKRLDYLIKHGHKFMNVVYIGGHVFMYVGAYPNPQDPAHPIVALSYQNMWGLRPQGATPSTDKRVVIGQAVFFPLLKTYPEDQTLSSPADKKIFQIAYLDDISENLSFDPYKVDIHSLLNP